MNFTTATAEQLNAAGFKIKQLKQRGPRKSSYRAKAGGRAVGNVRGSDFNGAGSMLRASSGAGMTFTAAAGLGKDMVKDLGATQRRYQAQMKADRRAFVLGGSAA